MVIICLICVVEVQLAGLDSVSICWFSFELDHLFCSLEHVRKASPDVELNCHNVFSIILVKRSLEQGKIIVQNVDLPP